MSVKIVSHVWAPLLVTLEQTATGERRTYLDDHGLMDGEFSDYIWSEGNYSCDCNRQLFWNRAGGEDDVERGCGDGAYRVVGITSLDGTMTYYEEPRTETEFSD